MLVGRRGDIGISYLELHLLRFLDQHLFVDQLTQHLPGKRGLTSRVGRKLQPLRPALIYCGENITPKNCLVADDRDNAIDGQRRGSRARRDGGGLRHDTNRRHGSQKNESLDHSRSYPATEL